MGAASDEWTLSDALRDGARYDPNLVACWSRCFNHIKHSVYFRTYSSCGGWLRCLGSERCSSWNSRITPLAMCLSFVPVEFGAVCRLRLRILSRREEAAQTMVKIWHLKFRGIEFVESIELPKGQRLRCLSRSWC